MLLVIVFGLVCIYIPVIGIKGYINKRVQEEVEARTSDYVDGEFTTTELNRCK